MNLGFAQAIHLVAMPKLLNPDVTRFEPTLAAFDAENASDDAPPQGGVMFYGSSSIRMWDLATAFPGADLINRGFGGSHLAECVYHFDRIVLPLHPHTLFVYAGDNDVAAGGDAYHVLDHFVELVTRLRTHLPSTRVYFLAIKPSPSRWHLWPIARKANAMVEGYAHITSGVSFVDTATPLLHAGPVGEHDLHPPSADRYIDDHLHLNAEGYAIWAELLQPLVAAECR